MFGEKTEADKWVKRTMELCKSVVFELWSHRWDTFVFTHSLLYFQFESASANSSVFVVTQKSIQEFYRKEITLKIWHVQVLVVKNDSILHNHICTMSLNSWVIASHLLIVIESKWRKKKFSSIHGFIQQNLSSAYCVLGIVPNIKDRNTLLKGD